MRLPVIVIGTTSANFHWRLFTATATILFAQAAEHIAYDPVGSAEADPPQTALVEPFALYAPGLLRFEVTAKLAGQKRWFENRLSCNILSDPSGSVGTMDSRSQTIPR